MNVIDITSDVRKSTEKVQLGAYCRVSSDSEDQLHSFAAQIRHFKDYEQRHPEYKLVDIYADEGLTGTTTENRSELHRLIRDCQNGKLDRIIIKSVSRLARNTRDLLVAIRMFKDLGVSVYFEEQDIDTDKMNMEMIVTFCTCRAWACSVSPIFSMMMVFQTVMSVANGIVQQLRTSSTTKDIWATPCSKRVTQRKRFHIKRKKIKASCLNTMLRAAIQLL